MLDIIKPPCLNDFKEVYVIQELMQTDLHRVIRTQSLSDDRDCQLLRALESIYSANVVHRDLEPANLLLNANYDLEVCDFSLARSSKAVPGAKEAGLTAEYVATRWYRAPEIILSFKMYAKVVTDVALPDQQRC
ncbi:kinase-like domain-containing protein [Boletus coccyginus]|nr:kinase-like domain-containing protein [Boletus coccyginus]